MPELKSAYIGELKIAVTSTYMLGDGPLGRRRIDLLSEGRFEGPRISAKLLPGGMDLLLGGSDGAVRPDVRLPLELDDGHHLLIIYRGVRHAPAEVMARIAAGERVPPESHFYRGVRHAPAEVMARIAAGERVPPESHYLRTALVFETASPKYDWLNRIVGIGVGRREPEFAVYDVFEVL